VVVHRSGVTVRDVSFESRGKRIDAYLVAGSGKGVRPGVVVVHGSGGDRTELLGAAAELARRGFVALAITAPSTAYPPPSPTTVADLVAESRAVTVADVVAVRRAGDVLASLPTVDRARMGYLGWSAGAKTGAFVAAADGRFRALALLSAGADKLSAFVNSAPAGSRSLVRRGLGSVDPLRYIAAARPGTLLLEDGRSDQIVPRNALENMIHAAPSGTTVRWYEAGHELNPAAYRAAFAWLAGKLHAG
jgi:dienelactone hydrolase